MSRAALMCCTALALALSVGAAHAGPEYPWQFLGRWCSQEHKYGTDTLIFGRQLSGRVDEHTVRFGLPTTGIVSPLRVTSLALAEDFTLVPQAGRRAKSCRSGPFDLDEIQRSSVRTGRQATLSALATPAIGIKV